MAVPPQPVSLSVYWTAWESNAVSFTMADASHTGLRLEREQFGEWLFVFNVHSSLLSLSDYDVYLTDYETNRPWRICGYNGDGDGPYLTINSIGSGSLPSTPSAFSIAYKPAWDVNVIGVTFASTDHLGYKVERLDDSTWNVIERAYTTATTLTDVIIPGSEADANKTHRFYAANDYGYSSYRESIVLNVPTNLVVSRNNSNDLRSLYISWDGTLATSDTWVVTHSDIMGYPDIHELGRTTNNHLTVNLDIWFDYTITVKALGGSSTATQSLTACYSSIDFNQGFNLSTLLAEQSPTPHKVQLTYSLICDWVKYVVDPSLYGYVVYYFHLTLSKPNKTDIVTDHSFDIISDEELQFTGDLESPVIGNDGWKGVLSLTLTATSSACSIEKSATSSLSNVVGEPILPNLTSFTISSVKEGVAIYNYTPVPWHRRNQIMVHWTWENNLFQDDIELFACIDGEWQPLIEVTAYQFNGAVDLEIFADSFYSEMLWLSLYEEGLLCRAFQGKYFDGRQKADYSSFVIPTNGNTQPALCELFHDVQVKARIVGSNDYLTTEVVEQIGLRSGIHPIMYRNPGEFANFLPEVINGQCYVSYGSTWNHVPIRDFFAHQDFLVSCDGDEFVVYGKLAPIFDSKLVYTHDPEGTLIDNIDYVLGGLGLKTLQEQNGIKEDTWMTSIAGSVIKQLLDRVYYGQHHGYDIGNIYIDEENDLASFRLNPAQFIQRKYLDGQSHTITHKIKRYNQQGQLLIEFDFPSYTMTLPNVFTRTNYYDQYIHTFVRNNNHQIDINLVRNEPFIPEHFVDYWDIGDPLFFEHAPYHSYMVVNHSQRVTNEHAAIYTIENELNTLTTTQRKFDIATGESDEFLITYPLGGLGAAYREGLLNHLLRGIELDKPTEFTFALVDNTLTELSGNNYSRVTIAVGDEWWSRLSEFTSTIGNNQPIVFAMPSADWENVIGWILFDSEDQPVVSGQFLKPITIQANRTNPVINTQLLQIVVA